MSTEKTPQRWYVVADKSDGAACLVEASNRAQAFRRAGEFYCTARPATVDEALRMARDGRDVIYAPSTPEQLDLEEQANGAVDGSSADTSKGGGTPGATDPAPGPLNEPEPELPKVTDIVPEARRAEPPKPRKASDVFGAGFGPRSAADDID